MDVKFAVAGGLLGMIAFVGCLESKGMGSIIYRNGRLNFHGVVPYIKSPFYQSYLWYPQLWMHNWIVMGVGGALSGALSGALVQSIMN